MTSIAEKKQEHHSREGPADAEAMPKRLQLLDGANEAECNQGDKMSPSDTCEQSDHQHRGQTAAKKQRTHCRESVESGPTLVSRPVHSAQSEADVPQGSLHSLDKALDDLADDLRMDSHRCQNLWNEEDLKLCRGSKRGHSNLLDLQRRMSPSRKAAKGEEMQAAEIAVEVSPKSCGSNSMH